MDKVIAIVGPTAVGKTKLSVELAKKINGEVINADSTQIFKDLNIATAKTTDEEKEGVPHYLFDIKNIEEDYSVFEYQNDVRNLIKDIISRGKTPILCGGTGLYIKAALYNYEFSENNEKFDMEHLTNEFLFEEVKKLDPNTKIHINNRQRLLRAYESILNTGELPTKDTNDLLYDVKFIGLTTARDVLYERINKRVDVMVNNGLLEEAKWVYGTNVRSKAVMTPIGYKELFPYFDGEETLENCLEEIKQGSRRYAKRQYTWFNNQFDTKWYDVNFSDFSETVDNVIKDLEKDFI